MKKILKLSLIAFALILVSTGCMKNDKLDMELTEIIDKIYDGVKDVPKVGSIEITKDNMKNYLGVDDLDIKEGIASEAMIGSIPFSVVVLRLNDASNVEDVKVSIEENADPRKWICVEAEEVIVDNRGDVVILIMANKEQAPKIHENFLNL